MRELPEAKAAAKAADQGGRGGRLQRKGMSGTGAERERARRRPSPEGGIDLMKSQQALGLWRKAIQRVIIYTHLGGERCTCLIC